MTDAEKEIHARAIEATARQTLRAIFATDKSDLKLAILMLAINDWFEKGMLFGKRS